MSKWNRRMGYGTERAAFALPGGHNTLSVTVRNREVTMKRCGPLVNVSGVFVADGRREAMRHKAWMALLAIVIGAIPLLVGCAATHPSLAGSAGYRAVDVEFPSHIVVASDEDVALTGHPKSLVEFALRLSNEGRHLRAAGFFVEASQAPSSDNGFTVACLAAAANEYFLGGALEPWKRTVGVLRQRMDRFQLASVDGLAEIHLALCDVAEGREIPRSSRPF